MSSALDVQSSTVTVRRLVEDMVGQVAAVTGLHVSDAQQLLVRDAPSEQLTDTPHG